MIFGIHRRPAVVVGILVAICAFAVRLPGLGAILTADEPQWVFRAQSFMTALKRGDLGGTFQGTHPGVVPMLLIGTGIEARALFTGERLESPTIGNFRTAAKLPIAIAVSFGVGLAAAFAVRLWGVGPALGMSVFLVLEPFFVGHSQLAHVDALLAVLMLLTVLASLWYSRTNQRWILVLSGFLGGLALLTKLPAVLLVPLSIGMFLLFPATRPRWRRDAAVWVGVAAATFLILWPSMWSHALPNARYVARDVESVTTTSHYGESTDVAVRDRLFYARALLTRTSPVALLLAVAGIIALVRTPHRRRDAVVFLLFFGGFFLLVNMVEKRADRYLLPGILPLCVFAGFSLAELFHRGRFGKLLTGGAVGLLALLTLLHSPYAVSYASPLSPAEEPTQAGWGEGLEQAAAVLNRHPLASELHVATWYPIIFREFFHGTTMSLSSRDDARVDYVVTYLNMFGRPSDSGPTAVLAEFAGQEPVETITIAGREVAWIYAQDSVDRFSQHVGEIVRPGSPARGTGNAPTAIEVGQEFTAERDGLRGIRFVFATFSSRENHGELLVQLREQGSANILRTARIDVRKLEDNGWHEIAFEPITDSAGKTYEVTLASPAGTPGNAVTIRYQPKDILPGAAIIRRSDESHERPSAGGDLAYGIMYTK